MLVARIANERTCSKHILQRELNAARLVGARDGPDRGGAEAAIRPASLRSIGEVKGLEAELEPVLAPGHREVPGHHEVCEHGDQGFTDRVNEVHRGGYFPNSLHCF